MATSDAIMADELAGLFQYLQGISRFGDREMDQKLVMWLEENTTWRMNRTHHGMRPHFTSSLDDANEFLTVALPGYQMHVLHGGETAWSCEICRTGHAMDAAEGEGKTGPLAILSAALIGLLSKKYLKPAANPK